MSRLSHRLGQLEGVHFTAYADDVNWAEARQHRHTDQAFNLLQEALTAFEDQLAFTDMQVSAEKTQYIIIKGTPTERAKVRLRTGGRELKRPEGG